MDNIIITSETTLSERSNRVATTNLGYAIIIWFPEKSTEQIDIIIRVASGWSCEDSAIEIGSDIFDIKFGEGFVER